jgi:hypothetical protein
MNELHLCSAPPLPVDQVVRKLGSQLCFMRYIPEAGHPSADVTEIG